MPVYLVRAGADGLVIKIGYSGATTAAGLINRLSIMQSNNHVRLVLMRVLDGDIYVERALHQRFAHLRLHGEWFTYTPEMEGDLGFADWPPAATLHKPWPIMERGTEELRAKKVQSHRATWNDPVKRESMMHLKLARAARRGASQRPPP